MALILIGAGTVLYTLTVTLETLIEGRLTDHFRSRRMTREIDPVPKSQVPTAAAATAWVEAGTTMCSTR